MRKLSGILVLFLLLVGVSAPAGGIKLPGDVQILRNNPSDGQTWEQCGTVRLTFAAARKNFDLALRRQGWRKIRTVDFDRIRWKTLELWEKGSEQLLVQYWKEEISLTGFAWGRLKNGDRT